MLEEMKVPADTRWKDACEMFSKNAIFNSADRLDQLTAFVEYVKGAERAEQVTRKREKRRQERINREQFRALLDEKYAAVQLTHKTKWKEFAARVKDDHRYFSMVGQPGSQPRELFEDFVELEKENFKRQKGIFKALVKSRGIKLGNCVVF